MAKAYAEKDRSSGRVVLRLLLEDAEIAGLQSGEPVEVEVDYQMLTPPGAGIRASNAAPDLVEVTSASAASQ